MTQTTITAGDAVNGLVQAAGNDGTMVLQTGPNGAKVNALSVDSTGKGTFVKTPICTDAPVFSAYLNSAQTVSNSALTKLQAGIKEFDTNNAYDNATNYRFLPLVAGYYQINGQIYLSGTSGLTGGQIWIYKNGAAAKQGAVVYPASAPAGLSVTVSAIVFLNGSTDYVELYASLTGTGTLSFASQSGQISYFQGSLIRAA